MRLVNNKNKVVGRSVSDGSHTSCRDQHWWMWRESTARPAVPVCLFSRS